jgi:hypothetical protein
MPVTTLQRRDEAGSGFAAPHWLLSVMRAMNDKQTDKSRSKQDRLLDEALAETFPASDPISLQQIVVVGRVDRPLLDGVPRVKTEKRS